MTDSQAINRDDLMAYVDGRLGDERRRQVEALALGDPAVAALLSDYSAQRQLLREALLPVLDEPVPERLRMTPPRRNQWPAFARTAAAAACGMFVGSLATWTILQHGPERLFAGNGASAGRHSKDLPLLVRQATVAHSVYAPDVRRPVEVPGREEAALEAWLSKRLGRRIDVPSRLPEGLVLVGGRLLPAEPDRPAAQLMYEDGKGVRVTVYLRSLQEPSTETAFRFGEKDGLGTFYWVDRNWGYALTGELPRDALLRVARAIYEQLGTRD